MGIRTWNLSPDPPVIHPVAVDKSCGMKPEVLPFHKTVIL